MSSPTPIPDALDEEFCPSVTVKLGRKEYRLGFSMASVLAFKRQTGRNLFTGDGWVNFNLRDDPDSIVAFFWAALQTFHPEISYDQATRMANFGNMKKIADACNKALAAFLPESDGDEGETKEPPITEKSIGSGTGR
jgi:hypothetical protein